MKLKLLLIVILFGLTLALYKPKVKADDCQVAWDIAFQDAYEQCMGDVGDDTWCKAYAHGQANNHAVDIGCPPMN